jgi:predicted TIM-barrel fold metal-dependent hydrolase
MTAADLAAYPWAGRSLREKGGCVGRSAHPLATRRTASSEPILSTTHLVFILGTVIRPVFVTAVAVLLATNGGGSPAQPFVPAVDHHQHLFSADAAALARGFRPMDGANLIALLDAAGIRRAVVFSTAYQWSNPNRPSVDNEYAHVKAENDWTSAQVARFRERLRGFCGLNPLRDYALDEIARCSADRSLRFGIKLHFGNSDVDLDNPEHIVQLQRVFRAANQRGMAIVVHMRSSITRNRPYGTAEARAFIERVLPSAPDIPIQIAHLTGGGTFDDPKVDEALGEFIRAFRAKDPRVEHVWMDVSGIAGYGDWRGKAPVIAQRIREVGLGRILYGSDSANGGGLSPQAAWAAFRELPLSEEQLRTIATNVGPYMQ